MVNNQVFQISDDCFWGFKREIDIDKYTSLGDIVHSFIEKLKKVLKDENMEILIEKLDKKKYHIHDLHFSTLKSMVQEKHIIYVCECSNN